MTDPGTLSSDVVLPAGDLVIGPLLRHVAGTSATVWVETARRGEVAVRAGDAAGSARTVTVGGHHFALVVVEGLEPGGETDYAVDLDGTQVWPLPDDPRPAPRIRSLPERGSRTPPAGSDGSDPTTTRDVQAAHDEAAREGALAPDPPHAGSPAPSGSQTPALSIALGSCRVDRPQLPPFTRDVGEEAVGVDALVALSVACQRGRRTPDLLLMLGDQVYADEGLSPGMRERITAKRGDAEPHGEVGDFEEYTWLYAESWADPEVRWLLATTPTAMIFDDHDVRDDWNTSRAWREHVQTLPWWRGRIAGAYASYWLYQHLGNLEPARLAADDLWARVREIGEEGDAEEVLREFALDADAQVDGSGTSQWSYVRDLGRTRLVVVDTRSGRVLSDDRRTMLDEEEMRAVEDALVGDVDHLLVASSLPVLLEPALHDLEAWNAATASGGAWGERFRPRAEALRQAVDLEHWGAFETSFRRLVDRVGAVAAGEHGREPGSVLFLSGDVHHGYVAPLSFRPDRGVRAPVWQVTSSPLRNGLPRGLTTAFRLLHTPLARAVGRLLRRTVGAEPLDVHWRSTTGPMLGNGVATLVLLGRSARVVFEKAEPGRGPGTDPAAPDDVRLREDRELFLA